MSNFFKHFVCYTLLILTLLFCFALYKKTELLKEADEGAFVKVMAQSQTKAKQDEAAIKQRDTQVAQANAALTREQTNAKTIQQQLDLLAELAKDQGFKYTSRTEWPVVAGEAYVGYPRDTTPTRPNPSIDTGEKPGIFIDNENVPAYLSHEVECKKCSNELPALQADLKDKTDEVAQKDSEVKACKTELDKQPHNRITRFIKGLKWTFTLGKK